MVAIKYLNFALLIVVLTVGGSTSQNTTPSLNSRAIKLFLGYLLKTQGIDFDEFHAKLAQIQSLEDLITSINTCLRQEMIIIDGDVVKLNSKTVENLITSTIQSMLQNELPNNPFVILSIQQTIQKQISSKSAELEQLLSGKTVPVSIARNSLAQFIQSVHRAKRAAEDTPVAADLVDFIYDMIFDMIRAQLAVFLRPIQIAINTTLTETINTISALNITEAPNNDLNWLICFAQNMDVVQVMELLTHIGVALNDVFDSLLRPSVAVHRQRRDLAVSPSDEIQGTFIVVDWIFGILDYILRFIRMPLYIFIWNCIDILVIYIYPWLGVSVQYILGFIFLVEIVNAYLVYIFPLIGYIVIPSVRILIGWLVDILDLVLNYIRSSYN